MQMTTFYLLLSVLGFVADEVAVLGTGDPSQIEAIHKFNPASGFVLTGGLPNDDTTQFLSTVLAETEDVWNAIFNAEGLQYEEPTLVLFSSQVVSACGSISTASGPAYCPVDRKVYLDSTYFRELDVLGVSGDFAQAFLIAKEVGHHVQNLTGILPKFNELRQTMSQGEANQMSTRMELQADCFAGA
jgi:predicted metalloprotease